jgi:pectate lyase
MQRFQSAILGVMVAGLVACGGSQGQNGSSSSSSSASSSASSSTSASSSSSSSSSASSSGGQIVSLTIQEVTTGFCYADYSAASGGVDTEHAGYTGSGYIDVQNAQSSRIEWQIQTSEASVYTVKFRYANGAGSSRSGVLTANGNAGSAVTFEFAPTGGWPNWVEESREISLNAGTNRLVLTGVSAEGIANIDSITLSGPGVTAQACSGASSSSSSSSSASSTSSSSSSSSGGVGNTPRMSISQFVGYGSPVTGGEGGQVVTATTGTEIHRALCQRTSTSTPLVIMVNGTINHGNTTKVSGNCDTAADRIQLKGVKNVSIIGVGRNAVFDQIGIFIRDAENIIIRNVHVKNVKKSGSPTSNGGDAIAIEGGPQTRIWIDRNTLEASGGESDGYDSLIDMKNSTTYVTVSYNHFRNSSRGGLIGANDNPDGNNYIVFHHNFYENIEQRTPLLRRATIHVFNNYWENNGSMGQIHYVNARAEGKALVQNNYFKNVNNPLLSSTDSDVPGCWSASGNIWDGGTYTRTPSNGNAHYVPPNWQSRNINGTVAGCNPSGASGLQLDDAANVPAIVKTHAGAGKL